MTAPIHSAIRPAAVAGLFYPADARSLETQLATLLGGSRAQESRPAPAALVVPHAGYRYSGLVAARAYAALGSAADTLRRIVLVGPSHHAGFRGLALPSVAAFATPIGAMELDEDGVNAILALRGVRLDDAAHAPEHSLEVQLPFLRRLAGGARIVPVLTGEADPAEVARVIEALWEDRTLIVVSSDLSHYHPYDTAQQLDAATAQAILAGRTDLTGERACGFVALNGLVRAARARGLRTELMDLRNSGDSGGARQRVVGYGAFAFHAA